MTTDLKTTAIVDPIRKSVRGAEVLVEELRRLIVEGEIRPGEHLPTEKALAERFNVTRNAVREAIRSLEGRHLLSVRKGSRVTVHDYLANAGLDFVADLFASSQGVSSKLVRDVAEGARVIRKAMMLFAVENLREECIPDIFEAVDIFCTESGRPDPDMCVLQDLDFEIHNRLLRSTDNHFMILLNNSIRRICAQVAKISGPVMAHHPVLAANYRAMAGYLKEGKRQEARDVFEEIFELGTYSLG